MISSTNRWNGGISRSWTRTLGRLILTLLIQHNTVFLYANIREKCSRQRCGGHLFISMYTCHVILRVRDQRVRPAVVILRFHCGKADHQTTKRYEDLEKDLQSKVHWQVYLKNTCCSYPVTEGVRVRLATVIQISLQLRRLSNGKENQRFFSNLNSQAKLSKMHEESLMLLSYHRRETSYRNL